MAPSVERQAALPSHSCFRLSPQSDVARRLGAEQFPALPHLRMRSDLAALRMRLAYLAVGRQKANFDERQPRWPKGSGEISGRWSGSSNAGALAERIRVAGTGHHYVPRATFRNPAYGLPAETQRVLEQFVTGPLGQGAHYYSADHRQYNAAVDDLFGRYLRDRRIDSRQMTPGQAISFGLDVLRSQDPRVSEFNKRVLRRRLIFLIWRLPFRANE